MSYQRGTGTTLCIWKKNILFNCLVFDKLLTQCGSIMLSEYLMKGLAVQRLHAFRPLFLEKSGAWERPMSRPETGTYNNEEMIYIDHWYFIPLMGMDLSLCEYNVKLEMAWILYYTVLFPQKHFTCNEYGINRDLCLNSYFLMGIYNATRFFFIPEGV